jgi:hypothetical protein
MTTKELLADLNALREKSGKAPIKVWKASRTKLEEAIKACDSVSAEPVKTVKASGNGVSLVEIAKELDMDDKVARAKLRRMGDVVPTSGGEHRWVFAAKDVPTVKGLLQGDRRVKE